MTAKQILFISCAIGLAAGAAPPSCQQPEKKDWKVADSVISQLRWLARNQQADGAWGNPKSPPPVRTRLTGMALINFAAAEYSHFSKDVMDGFVVGPAIRRGLQSLTARQDDKGCLTPGDNNLEAHLWGSLALTEHYAMTESLILKENAVKAVAYLESLQRPDGGWGTGDAPDPMTTLLALLVVESARAGGLEVPDAMVRGANDAQASLAERDARKAFDPVTTAALLAVVSIWESDRAAWYAPFAATWAERTARALDNGTAADVRLVHWGSMALSHYDGPNYHGNRESRPAGKQWNAWSEKLKILMRDSQRTEVPDEIRGSWDPPKQGGQEPIAPDDARIEATCLNGLNLQLFFQWGPSPDLKYKSCRRVWIHNMEPW